MSPERVSVGEKEEGHSVDRPKTKKAWEPTVESGAGNMKAESIRRRAESIGRCVQLKTVTEITDYYIHFFNVSQKLKVKVVWSGDICSIKTN